MMRDFCGMLVASLLMVGAAATPSVARAPVYSDLKKDYLDKLAASKTPVLVASCFVRQGKVLAIVPVGAAEGKLVALSWHYGSPRDPRLASVSAFVVAGEAKLRNTVQSEQGSWQPSEQTLGNLIQLPFTLVLPSQFGTILGMQPSTKCVPDRD